MAAEMHTTPLRVSRLATNAMRLMLVSLSSRLNPSPLLKCVRTISPSRISTLRPCCFKRCSIISARVLFPEPERPVNHIVKPLLAIYGIFSLYICSSGGAWRPQGAPLHVRPPSVILSPSLRSRVNSAKDLSPGRAQILRCAQDDSSAEGNAYEPLRLPSVILSI